MAAAWLAAVSVQGQPSATSQTLPFLPSVTLQNPLSPGTLGTVVASAVVQHRTRLANETDANAELYLGLGAPAKWLGAGVTFNIHGLSNSSGERDNLGKGTVSFHLNRYLFKQQLLLGAGLDNALSWGGSRASRQYITYQPSLYITANYHLFTGPEANRLWSLTLGAGNGYYRRDEDYTPAGSGALNPFASLSTPLTGWSHLIAEWNGYNLGFGWAAIPSRKFPAMLRLEATDLVNRPVRWVASLSLPFQFAGKTAATATGFLFTKSIRPARTI